MRICDEHLYHGAALNQIAEHPKFTEINAFKIKKANSRSTFWINDDIAVYLKYASAPKAPHGEYLFSFNEDHLAELDFVTKKAPKTYVALICVKAREICCLSASEVFGLIQRRRKILGADEPVYGILVTAKKGQKLRAYVNEPHTKNRLLGEMKVSRNAFPERLFE